MYNILNNNGHYEVYKENKFKISCDSKEEAYREINKTNRFEVIYIDKEDIIKYCIFKVNGIVNKKEAKNIFETKYNCKVINIYEFEV